MSRQSNIANQTAAVARELTALIELVSDVELLLLSGGASLPGDESLSGGAAIADAIAAVESAGRLVDCARVRVLAPLVGDSALVERLGYTSSIAAVASIAQISERSARARLTVAAAVCPNRAITGAPLPAANPMVSEALDTGAVGLDAATLIATLIASVAGRAPSDVLDIAESVMVGLATGVSSTGEPMVAAVSVDYLAVELRQVTAAVDPDGARPREERAVRRRDFRLGAPDEDGLVPANGRLLPEIGSLLSGLLEAHRRSPRFVEPAAGPDAYADAYADADADADADAGLSSADDLALGADSRTPGQRRHDALGEVLMAAAAAKGAPRLDGQPVAVLVTVTAADLANHDGLDADPIGTMAGSPFPVSRRGIERFIDAGGYRVVTTDENGAVTAISSPQRCFTPIHRLAIAARDGQRCATPGCTSPHYALQAHHVIPDRDNGPTAVDNGILLCYWHHQLVDTGPWQYLMVKGMPYVRGPGIPDWTPTRKLLLRAA